MRIKKLYNSLSLLEKIVFIGAIVLFASAAAVKLSFYIEQNSLLKPAKGGQFKEGIIGQPVFINPIMPSTSTDKEISKLIFASLYDLSDSITHSTDALTWNVRLKQDLLWHDGAPITSDDIIFTLDTIQNRESHSPYFLAFQGVKAERVSQLEVIFKLQLPYALFNEESLKNFGVIPKHIFGDLPVQNFGLSIYGLKPVGSGPYKVEAYDKDDRGVINTYYLDANKSYFKGEPNISRIVIKFFRDNTDLIAAYNNTKIDGFGMANAFELLNPKEKQSGSDLPAINIRHQTHDLKTSGYYAVFFNLAEESKDLKNIKVRQALSESIDRLALINSVFGKYASPYYGPTNFTKPNETPADLSLIKGLGLNLTVPDEPFLKKTAEEIKKMWEAAGAVVQITLVPLDKIQETFIRNDYQMILFGNVTGPSNDLFSFWHSSQRFYPGQNLSLYQSKKTDSLIESFGKTFDKDAQVSLLKQISDQVAADYAAVFLYSPRYVYVTIPNLQGFDESTEIYSSSDRFNSVSEWYLKTARKF